MAEFLNLYKILIDQLDQGGASLNDVITWDGLKWAPAPGGGGNPLVTDIQQTGAVAGDQIEWNGVSWVPYTLHDPVFSYNLDGTVNVITYAGGATKTFNYNLNGSVDFIDFLRSAVTIRKTFAYNLDGSVQSITRSIF